MATMTQERTERETSRQAQPEDAPQTQGDAPTPMSITIVENGPYVVNGSAPLLEEAITPVGGATLKVLAAYAAAALAGSSRRAALVVVAVWLFFALVWDPNVPQLVLLRGLPLLVLCLLCACVWRALGASEYAWRKLGGAR